MPTVLPEAEFVSRTVCDCSFNIGNSGAFLCDINHFFDKA